MQQIISILTNSLFNSIIAIISLALAVYFYLKSIKNKEPRYWIESFNLIQDYSSIFKDLNITYKGEAVSNITATDILLWNAGKNTIDKNDITTKEPLRLETQEGIKILEYKLKQPKESANNIQLTLNEDGTCLSIIFDYLDEGDIFKIQIIHTGQTSEDIQLKGVIIGVKNIGKTIPPNFLLDGINNLLLLNLIPWLNLELLQEKKDSKYMVGIALILAPITLWSVIFYFHSILFNLTNPIAILFYISLSIVSIGFILLGLYFLIVKIPKNFDTLYEDVENQNS